MDSIPRIENPKSSDQPKPSDRLNQMRAQARRLSNADQPQKAEENLKAGLNAESLSNLKKFWERGKQLPDTYTHRYQQLIDACNILENHIKGLSDRAKVLPAANILASNLSHLMKYILKQNTLDESTLLAERTLNDIIISIHPMDLNKLRQYVIQQSPKEKYDINNAFFEDGTELVFKRGTENVRKFFIPKENIDMKEALSVLKEADPNLTLKKLYHIINDGRAKNWENTTFELPEVTDTTRAKYNISNASSAEGTELIFKRGTEHVRKFFIPKADRNIREALSVLKEADPNLTLSKLHHIIRNEEGRGAKNWENVKHINT